MKRISLITALLGAIVLAFSGIAMADTGSVIPTGSSAVGGASGKGMQVIHYTATYNDSLYGPVSCVGVHQEKAGKQTQENFTCTSTSGSPLWTVSPNQAFTPGGGAGWWSDWAYFTQNQIVAATSVTATVSADGMSYSAVATY